MAFEEKRGVVSLKRGKGPLRNTPPTLFFFCSPTFPSPFLSSPLLSLSERPPLTLLPNMRARTHIFTIAQWLWGDTEARLELCFFNKGEEALL